MRGRRYPLICFDLIVQTTIEPPLTDFSSGPFEELIETHLPLPRLTFLVDRKVTNCKNAALHLLIADYQHVRHLVDLGLTDLVTHLLAAPVVMAPESIRQKFLIDLFGKILMPLGYGDDTDLFRGNPKRELAGKLLDQDTHKPLQTP